MYIVCPVSFDEISYLRPRVMGQMAEFYGKLKTIDATIPQVKKVLVLFPR